VEILKGVHLVTGPLGGNIYLLKIENNFILIDTGMPKSESYIFKYIGRFRKEPADLKLLLLTHCHLDHVGSAHAVKEKSKAKVCAHRDEVDCIEGRREPPVPNVRGLKGASVRFSMRSGRYRPVHVENPLVDTQMVGPLQTMHLPGHTPGSIGFYYEKYDMLFCGDAMTTFNDNLNGPLEEFDSDEAAVRRSAQRIADLSPLYVCPGHGPILRAEDDDLWDAFAVDMGVKRVKPDKKRAKTTSIEIPEIGGKKKKTGFFKR